MKKHFLFSVLAIFITVFGKAQFYSWAKTIGGGGTQGSSTAYAMKLDATGNLFVTGVFNSTCYFDLPAATYSLGATAGGYYDFFIAKYDNTSAFVWAKKMGGASSDIANTIDIDAAGNIYVAGTFSGTADFDPGAATLNITSTGMRDGFIAKYDNNGNYIWAKKIGGTDEQSISELKVDAAGNIYVTGNYKQTTDFDPSTATATLTSNGFDDFFIAKYDNSGNYIWAKSIGGANNDQSNSIQLDHAGNVFITGYFQGVSVDFDPGAATDYIFSSGVQDMFIAKYDNNGNYAWAKNIGGTGNNNTNSSYVLQLDATGNLYIAGVFAGTVDFDPSASTTSTMISTVGYTGFMAKYDGNGSYIWAKNTGGQGTGIEISSGGTIIMTGSFGSTTDFDPGPNVVNLSSNGYADIFISTYDMLGNYLSAKKMGGISNDVGTNIKLDAQDNIYVTGYYQYTCDFDPGPGTANLSSYGNQDCFIARYTNTLTAIQDHKLNESSIHIYPNPFNDKAVLKMPLNDGDTIEISLYNIMGQLISTSKNKITGNGDKTFEIATTENGVYFLHVNVNGNSAIKKLVKTD